MKPLPLSALSSLLLILSIPATAQNTNVKARPASMPIYHAKDAKKYMASMGNMPYTALYSSQAQIGDPAIARMIMNLYKDYETNNPRWKDAFADTATVVSSEGTVWKGKDKIVEWFTSQTNAVSSFAFQPHVWIPIKFTDKNENWVAVWGTIEVNLKDGTKVTNSTNEIWRINKDGKIDTMEQFEMKNPK